MFDRLPYRSTTADMPQGFAEGWKAALASLKDQHRMANTKSAKKAVRKIATRTAQNKVHRTRMRNEVRRVEEAIAAGDQNQAEVALKAAEPLIARVGQSGIVHKNTASRKISRLTKRVKALSAGA